MDPAPLTELSERLCTANYACHACSTPVEDPPRVSLYLNTPSLRCPSCDTPIIVLWDQDQDQAVDSSTDGDTDGT